MGVFLAFTLSQAGMVVHWWRQRGQHWRKSMLLNAIGAALSAIVFVIAGVTKFTPGGLGRVVVVVLLVLRRCASAATTTSSARRPPFGRTRSRSQATS